MATLLDFWLRNQRGPSSGEMVNARGTGIMQQDSTQQFAGPGGSHPAQVRRPNRADARRAPQQGQGAPQGPQPTAVNTPQGPQDLKAMQKNQRRGFLAQGIMSATNRELTSGQRKWIEETTEDEVENQARPGTSGQGAWSRLIAGNLPPAMTKREKSTLLSRAMTMAGLATLQSDERGIMALVEGIGHGRMYAQGIAQAWYSAAQDAGEELRRREAMQDAQQLFDGFATEDRSDLETWQLVRQEARERGMDGVLDLATKELELLSDLPAGTAEREVRVIDGTPYSFDSEGQAFDMDGDPVGTAAFSSEAAQERPIKRTFQRPDGTTIEALADPYTGEIVPGSEMVTERPGEGEDEDTVFQRTNALADDFRTETRDVQETLALAESAPQAGDNSAGDLRLIFVFNKLIDPGSRITEGEVRAGKNLGGMNAQARGFIDRVAEGRLPGPAREELMQEIEQMREFRTRQLGEIAQQYEERARTFGVRPDFVVRRGLIPELGGDTSGGGGTAGTAGSASDVDAIIERTFEGGS